MSETGLGFQKKDQGEQKACKTKTKIKYLICSTNTIDYTQ